MFRIALIYILFLFSFPVKHLAQPLTAFVNLQNQVMVWDNGVIRKIDYLPPVDMKIGRTAIPYLDNSRSFKIYTRGGVRNINNGFTNEFRATDNLVAFLNSRSLNIFDEGEVKNLTPLCVEYFLGDSLLLFIDGIRYEYKAYYNGDIYPIENFLAGDALDVIKVSDNIAAYDNYANQFRIFFHGQIIAQEDYSVSTFDVGRNTVAYVDINRQFKVFHSGKTTTLEDFPPDNYVVGDDLVAYTSSDGYFRIFYKDSLHTVGFFRPEYQVGDNVVAFRDGGGYFRVFSRGEFTNLEPYYPSSYVVQYNSVAYVNRGNVLRLFSDGELYDVTSIFSDGENNSDWSLNYDVLRYRVGLNAYKIFYRGNEY
jgi:hypothetical protein